MLLFAGPAADAQGQVKAMEQLAAEVEANSSIALRSVWKWTCYQACTFYMLFTPPSPRHSQLHTLLSLAAPPGLSWSTAGSECSSEVLCQLCLVMSMPATH